MAELNHTILFVEDDEALGFVTSDNLAESGFRVDWASNGRIALEKFEKNQYDLIILDVMLPKIDGYTLAESFRKSNEQVPIIFLSAKSMLEDRLEGLKAGGDDYLTKPFSMEELLLKINVFLKRSAQTPTSGDEIYRIGQYFFYPKEMKLKIKEEETSLTKKEVLVLEMLCKNIGEMLKREEILNKVWGNNDYFLGRSMDVFISKLRKHLRKDPTVSIVNYHGMGFKLICEG